MTNRELEKQIRTALEHTAPDRLDAILSSCNGQKNLMDAERSRDALAAASGLTSAGSRKKGAFMKRWRKPIAGIAAAVIALALCIGGYVLFGKKAPSEVDSVILLDVNPSIALYVDREETVLSAEALNEEAREILGSMKLEGTSMEVAVNAIVGAMLQKGYLGNLQNAILVSVENEDAERSEALQQKISQAVAAMLQTDSLDGAVLSQTLKADDAALAALSQQYGISMGKAALIQEVTAQDAGLTFDSLASMTIHEIALIASSRGSQGGSVAQTGTASAAAYIGDEKALELACAHAGADVSSVRRIQVEFDSEDGIIVYEVDFIAGTVEYEYDIDARTGEVLKYEWKQIAAQGGGSGDMPVPGNQETASGVPESTAASQGTAPVIPESTPPSQGTVPAVPESTSVSQETAPAIPEITAASQGTAPAIPESTPPIQETVPAAPESTPAAKETVPAAPETAPPTQASSQPASGNAGSGSSYIGEQAALDAALRHAGCQESDISHSRTELEYDDGRAEHYDVDFWVGNMEYEYEIDLYSGAVLKSSAEDHSDSGHGAPDTNTQDGQDRYIGADAALSAALNHAGVRASDLTKREVDLDEDDGRWIYEIEFEVGPVEYEYEIDALSGAVLKAERDS